MENNINLKKDILIKNVLASFVRVLKENRLYSSFINNNPRNNDDEYSTFSFFSSDNALDFESIYNNSIHMYRKMPSNMIKMQSIEVAIINLMAMQLARIAVQRVHGRPSSEEYGESMMRRELKIGKETFDMSCRLILGIDTTNEGIKELKMEE